MKKQLFLSLALLGALSATGSTFGKFGRTQQKGAQNDITVSIRDRGSMYAVMAHNYTLPSGSTIGDLREKIAEDSSNPDAGYEVEPKNVIIYKENTPTKLGNGIALEDMNAGGVRYYEYEISLINN